MTTEKLELRYIPLSQAKRWDANPKLHDLEALAHSIETHGFGDPPKFDAQLGGLVYGNGRTEALERLRREDKPPPRGIAVLEDGEHAGEWAVPVIFGVDAESKAAAVAFAIDHNNLTLLGAEADFTDLLTMWDEEALQRVVGETPDLADVLATFDVEDLSALVDGPDFAPGDEDESARLDERNSATCPECGHVFEP